jgi:NitT/TauT family transport system substrate-binding protein
MKKAAFIALAMILFSFPAPASARDRIDQLVLAGPQSSVTHPMAYIIEAGLLKDVADNVKLVIWDNPDQLRSFIAGEQVHFAAVPSYVAAIFHNKGIHLKLLNISTWGILWIVSSDPDVHALADLKGEEIVLTHRGDMPDLVLANLALEQGLDPARDFSLRYVPNYPAVSQEVVSGRARHALLAEPMVSVALMKSVAMEGGAPKLHRAIDIQEEWGRVHHTEPGIPQAGICAVPGILEHPHVVAAFQAAYREAIRWCNAHPREAGEIVAKHITGLNSRAVADALGNVGLKFVTAHDAKPRIEQFFRVLETFNPSKIGGGLPADDFYWSGE